jgi:cell division protein FtsQ
MVNRTKRFNKKSKIAIRKVSIVATFTVSLFCTWTFVRNVFFVLTNAVFPLKEVVVFGRNYTTQDEIITAINVKEGQSMFSFNLRHMHNQLAKLTWVKDVCVKRFLHGALHIHITEREPIAIFHNDGKFYLVDKLGTLIDSPVLPCFRDLPIVSGKSAESNVFHMLQLLREYKVVHLNISAMVFVKERRWNIKLNDTTEVKLPDKNVADALSILSRFIDDGKIPSTDILVIDLRLGNSIALKLSKTRQMVCKMLKGAKSV